MKECTNCGALVEDKAVVCKYCSFVLDGQQAAPVYPQAAQENRIPDPVQPPVAPEPPPLPPDPPAASTLPELELYNEPVSTAPPAQPPEPPAPTLEQQVWQDMPPQPQAPQPPTGPDGMNPDYTRAYQPQQQDPAGAPGQAQGQPPYGAAPGQPYGQQPPYGTQPGQQAPYQGQPDPSHGQQPPYGTQPGQPGAYQGQAGQAPYQQGQPPYGAQPGQQGPYQGQPGEAPYGQQPPYGGQPGYNPQQQPYAQYKDINRVTAGILALLLGGIGVHKFYMGKIGIGIVYVLFCWSFIPAIIGFIEGIIYLTMDDYSFREKYARIL